MRRKRRSSIQHRYDFMDESAGLGSEPPRRGRTRRLFRLTAWVVALAVAMAGLLAGYAAVRIRSGAREVAPLDNRSALEPMNLLVLGSDSREKLSGADRSRLDPTGIKGKRADTIILVHIDPRKEKAILVSFPRDLWITYPDGKTKGRINGVYRLGPDATVKAVEQFTNLGIHHYVEVDFLGFRKIVDALGGLKLNFSQPINDKDSGLNVKAGCSKLSGEQALAFVRVRKIDDDFGRIARQQLFIKLLLDKITSAGVLLNPVRLVRLINLVASNVERDDRLTLKDIRLLSQRLRHFDSSKIDNRVVPSEPARIGGASVVVARPQAKQLFEALASRAEPGDVGRVGVPSVSPANVSVTVLNGSGIPGAAVDTQKLLMEKGFVAEATGNADNPNYVKTIAYFSPEAEDKARLVAQVTGSEVKPLPRGVTTSSDVVVIVGQDFKAGASRPGTDVPASTSSPSALPEAIAGRGQKVTPC